MEREKKNTKEPENEQLASGDSKPGTGVDQITLETADEAVNTHILTPADIDELKAEAAKAKEHWNQLLRTAADFENYKKRSARERQDITKYANESLLQKLLPVLDNLESALASTAGTTLAESLQTGVKMIQQQLKGVLAEAGLEEVDALNKPFDPNWHEALSQQERADLPEGQVVQQIRKGYKLRDRLLRPAAVIVAKAPSASPPA